MIPTRKKRKGRAAGGKQSQAPTNPYVNPRYNNNNNNDNNKKAVEPKRIEIMEVKSKLPSKDQQRYSAIDRKLYGR